MTEDFSRRYLKGLVPRLAGSIIDTARIERHKALGLPVSLPSATPGGNEEGGALVNGQRVAPNVF